MKVTLERLQEILEIKIKQSKNDDRESYRQMNYSDYFRGKMDAFSEILEITETEYCDCFADPKNYE